MFDAFKEKHRPDRSYFARKIDSIADENLCSNSYSSFTRSKVLRKQSSSFSNMDDLLELMSKSSCGLKNSNRINIINNQRLNSAKSIKTIDELTVNEQHLVPNLNTNNNHNNITAINNTNINNKTKSNNMNYIKTILTKHNHSLNNGNYFKNRKVSISASSIGLAAANATKIAVSTTIDIDTSNKNPNDNIIVTTTLIESPKKVKTYGSFKSEQLTDLNNNSIHSQSNNQETDVNLYLPHLIKDSTRKSSTLSIFSNFKSHFKHNN